MERDSKSQRAPGGGGGGGGAAADLDFPLQWGNRKRLRCVRVRDDGGGGRRRAAWRINRRVIRGERDEENHFPLPSPNHLRKSESAGSESRRSAVSSPDKEDSRFYTTRGSVSALAAMGICEEDGGAQEERGERGGGVVVLPRFFVSLSNREKEEDFMVMKGCKLPQRPKKRAKLIQKALLMVSPGAWLSDLSQERYEVREKKSSRKRRRGLKALCLESDSE